MDPPTDVDPGTVLSGTSDWIDAEFAETLAHHPLDSIETEFPHHARAVDSPDGVDRPKERHPVFYGCYDWHSAVHSHWALVRQLRLFDDHPRRADVVESIDSRLTPENVEREVEQFAENESFEKPYGWAWFLHLAAELSLWAGEASDGSADVADAADTADADTDSVATEWRSTLEPLEARIVALVEDEFLTQERPFRVGTHGNSAFALHCVLDYARTVGDDSLESAATETALEFFAGDRDYPVEYEPLGWDFLSPALTEADLVRRVYDGDRFEGWLSGFLPDLTVAPFDSILDPVDVAAEPEEGVALHLAGLNVSKAWALAGVADALGDHRHADRLVRSAERHVERGLDQAFTDDYAGSHWLSSFVLYLLTRNEGGIAPA